MEQSPKERKALRETLKRYINPDERSILTHDAGLDPARLKMDAPLEQWLDEVERRLIAEGPAARKKFLDQCRHLYPALAMEPAFQAAWAKVKEVPVPDEAAGPSPLEPPHKRAGLWLALAALILCALAWAYTAGWRAPEQAGRRLEQTQAAPEADAVTEAETGAARPGIAQEGRGTTSSPPVTQDAGADRPARPPGQPQPGLSVRPRQPAQEAGKEAGLQGTKKMAAPATNHIEINIASHNTAEGGSQQIITGIEGGQVPIHIGAGKDPGETSGKQP